MVSAAMFNSYALADGSRTREIKFTYPWEFPFKYKDLNLDLHLTRPGGTSPDWFPMYPENWFVVFARGSFIAPDNLSYIDIMIDHALGDYEFIEPYICHNGMFLANLPSITKDGISKRYTGYYAWTNYGAVATKKLPVDQKGTQTEDTEDE